MLIRDLIDLKAFSPMVEADSSYPESLLTYAELRNYLEKHGDDKLDSEHAARLAGLLDHRWRRIQNTALAYPSAIHNPANKMCLVLAKKLSEYFMRRAEHSPSSYDPSDIGPNTLLMPTVKGRYNNITMQNFNDPSLNFSQFILSDDNEYFIEVAECLQDAENDGVLKYQITIGGQAKQLSETEQQRVIQHSSEAKRYYEAIKTYIELCNAEEGLLVRLKYLQTAFLNNSSKTIATEYVAGEDVYGEVTRFGDFLEKLSKENPEFKENLFKLEIKTKDYYGPKSFAELCSRLGENRESQSGNLHPKYCAVILANSIQYIIDYCEANPSFVPDCSIKTMCDKLKLAKAKETRAAAKHALVQRMKSSLASTGEVSEFKTDVNSRDPRVLVAKNLFNAVHHAYTVNNSRMLTAILHHTALSFENSENLINLEILIRRLQKEYPGKYSLVETAAIAFLRASREGCTLSVSQVLAPNSASTMPTARNPTSDLGPSGNNQKSAAFGVLLAHQQVSNLKTSSALQKSEAFNNAFNKAVDRYLAYRGKFFGITWLSASEESADAAKDINIAIKQGKSLADRKKILNDYLFKNPNKRFAKELIKSFGNSLRIKQK